MPASSASTIKPERDREDHRGLGDFQSRLNRGSHHEDRQRSNGYGERVDRKDRNGDRPMSLKIERDMDGGSVRIPNKGWDETPRRGPDGWGRSDPKKGMGWDQTPRSVRGGVKHERSPEGIEGVDLTGKEWEEEQVRLDRDWYTYDDEGAVAGDEEHNPFSQWENLEKAKEEELQAKATKRQTARQAQYVSDSLYEGSGWSMLTVRRTPTTICGKQIACYNLVLHNEGTLIWTSKTTRTPRCMSSCTISSRRSSTGPSPTHGSLSRSTLFGTRRVIWRSSVRRGRHWCGKGGRGKSGRRLRQRRRRLPERLWAI